MSAQTSLFAAPPVRKEAPPATKQDKAEPQREALHERDTNAVLTTLRGLLYEPDPTPQDAQALDNALAPYLPHACPSQADREMVWSYVWAHGPKSPCFAQTLTAQAIGLMESLWGVAAMIGETRAVGVGFDMDCAEAIKDAIRAAGLRVAVKDWCGSGFGFPHHAAKNGAWFSLIGQWSIEVVREGIGPLCVNLAPPKGTRTRSYRLGDWTALESWMRLLKHSLEARAQLNAATKTNAQTKAQARAQTHAAWEQAASHLRVDAAQLEFRTINPYPRPQTWALEVEIEHQARATEVSKRLGLMFFADGTSELEITTHRRCEHLMRRSFANPNPDLLARAGAWIRGEGPMPQEERQP